MSNVVEIKNNDLNFSQKQLSKEMAISKPVLKNFKNDITLHSPKKVNVSGDKTPERLFLNHSNVKGGSVYHSEPVNKIDEDYLEKNFIKK